MNEVESRKQKKIAGAILSSVLFSVVFLGFLIAISYFQFTEDDVIPWALYFIILVTFLIPVVCIFMNLISRIKEINGGEEDEALKY